MCHVNQIAGCVYTYALCILWNWTENQFCMESDSWLGAGMEILHAEIVVYTLSRVFSAKAIM